GSGTVATRREPCYAASGQNPGDSNRLPGRGRPWDASGLRPLWVQNVFGLRGTMLQAAQINAGQIIRLGVVGVRVMGANPARVLSELPGVALAGVADPDRKQAHAVGSALGCPAFGSVEELLSRGVDAVTIAAPTHLHRDIALTCIARGVHVMVEKP